MQHLGTLPLETEGLILRPLCLEDAPAMFDHWPSDPEVARYVTWEPHPDLESTKALLSSWVPHYQQDPSFYNWGIVLKSTEQLVGTISFVSVSDQDLSAELGYCLGRPWWGKGLMTEAGQAVLAFGFQKVGLNRIEAMFDVRNPASGRVMEKLGMTYEGLSCEARMVKGQLVTVKHYAKLRRDS